MRRAIAVVAAGLLAGVALVAASAPPGYAAQEQCYSSDQSFTPPQRPWALQRLQPERAWPVSRGEGVTVAVIDSGIDVSHPLLEGKVVGGRDFISGMPGSWDDDCSAHGTMVAGIIAAKESPDTEEVPFYGVAPDADLLSLRQTFSRQEPGTTSTMATAIRYAADQGADVINISVTTTQDDPAVRSAVDYAIAKDVVVVAAAGNEDVQNPQQTQGATFYPAAYDPVLAVAAVGPGDVQSQVSHSGSYVDIAAPGEEIISTVPMRPGPFAADSGTSFAAPYVSGVAALVRSHFPDMPAEQVVQRIKDTADPPVQGEENVATGVGVVNPHAAVGRVLPSTPAPSADPSLRGTPPTSATPDNTARNVAIASAGGGVLVIGLVFALATALPAGRRRGWRPGRRRPPADSGQDPAGGAD